MKYELNISLKIEQKVGPNSKLVGMYCLFSIIHV